MPDIPLWTVRLTYDSRQLLAWGLANFEPQGADAEMKDVMAAAIRDKADSVMLNALEIDYLDRLGCAALAADHPVRIDANRFLGTLPDTRRKKPDAIVNPAKGAKKQKSMFE